MYANPEGYISSVFHEPIFITDNGNDSPSWTLTKVNLNEYI